MKNKSIYGRKHTPVARKGYKWGGGVILNNFTNMQILAEANTIPKIR